MGTMLQYSLPDENAKDVSSGWFDAELDRHHDSNQTLKAHLAEEIDALRAWHNGETNITEAAYAITRPISTSSVPALGGYSDEITALVHLWEVFIDALVEWPSGRTPDIVALLAAIARVPDQIHRGEATDDDETPLTWAGLPYISMVWRDAHWMGAEEIIEECPDAASRRSARDVYIQQQDAEAQLNAAGIFQRMYAFHYVIRALEKKPVSNDVPGAAPDNDAMTDDLLNLDFHIPAVARWLKHNGQQLYDGLAKDEMKTWHKRDIPSGALHFDQPLDRWTFWRNRLEEIATDGPDDLTKNAAGVAVGYMQAVSSK